jgi:hypothetical protein
MGTLQWLGAPEWYPARVLALQRAGPDEWSISLEIASGVTIPLRAAGAQEIHDKKPLGMVVRSIALVTEGSARWVELRAPEGDDAELVFEGPAVRLELQPGLE